MDQSQFPFMDLGSRPCGSQMIVCGAKDSRASDGIRNELGNGHTMKILHVACSPRGQASESDRLSQTIIGLLLKREPTAIVVNRVIGGGALSHIDGSYATAMGATQQSPAEISPAGSMARSEELIQELESADVLVIGTPMHNFTLPSALKAWIDHVVRVRRTFNVTPQGKVGTLSDRPVFVAVSSGGRFSGERARQPDFLTPYLKAILATIGLQDLTFFSIEGSALGPDALAEARARTDRALEDYFSSFRPRSIGGILPPPAPAPSPPASASLSL
jgi:FMN-dependent NADH-azoreductase